MQPAKLINRMPPDELQRRGQDIANGQDPFLRILSMTIAMMQAFTLKQAT